MNDLLFGQKERLSQITSQLRRLFDEERRDAYEEARTRAAGPPINEDNYPRVQKPPQDPPEYPNILIATVVVLCIIVLLAAFLPSAFRLFAAGKGVFCTSWTEFTKQEASEELCNAVGVAAVILAEIGQTVALLSIAVLGTTSYTMDSADESRKKFVKATELSNKIFWGVAILTTLVAYVGNLHVAKPWLHASSDDFYGIFAWILDLVPPTLVIGIMYALKELVLYYIRRTFQYNLLIKEAHERRHLRIQQDITTRQTYLENPEVHPQWLKLYSLALRDSLILANRRQKGERVSADLDKRLTLMKSLSNDEWKYLIKLEMAADDFTVDPTHVTAVEKIQEQIKQQTTKENQAITEELVEELREEIREDIYQEDDGTWTFKSKHTGATWEGYPSRKEAERKRRQNYYHYNRYQQQKD